MAREGQGNRCELCEQRDRGGVTAEVPLPLHQARTQMTQNGGKALMAFGLNFSCFYWIYMLFWDF
jgi:hypothetical protein